MISIPLFCHIMLIDTIKIDNNRLSDYAYHLEKNSSGRNVSNYGGWQSDDLYVTDNTLHELKTTIEKNYFGKLYEICSLKDNFELVMDNFWFNINRKHNFNKNHNHRGLYSGVYYIKTPKNCGKIQFTNPTDTDIWGLNEQTTKSWNHFNSKIWEVTPEEGKIVLFPSWLYHSVLPNESLEDRISIAFNIFIKEK